MNSGKLRIGILSVVPSPYQRDLFYALSMQEDVSLAVYYQERQPHDSPWPEEPLAPYEKLLPGFYLRVGTVRSHVNWSLPNFDSADVWIINMALTSLTTQWVMRFGLRGQRWLFWGERIRAGRSPLRRLGQDFLASPLRNASGILAIGSLAKSDYAMRFPEVPLETIPYCTQLNAFSQEALLRIRTDDLRFLFCGQMIERKGIDLLLSAFSRLIEEGSRARLLLVGREAELPRWLATVSPAVRERIDYRGFHAPGKLPGLFAEADVFVIPSRHDGWGVVVNQALAAGMPVIGSDQVGAACDCIENNINGRLIPADDVDALHAAMRHLVQHRELVPQWGAASMTRADQLQPDVGAAKLVTMLQRVHGAN